MIGMHGLYLTPFTLTICWSLHNNVEGLWSRINKQVQQWVPSQQLMFVITIEFCHIALEIPVDRNGCLAGEL
jgi:hypothetical protein